MSWKYQHRTLEAFFFNASRSFDILLVTGPRQVGKTTFLRHLCGAERRYVSLDDPMARELAVSDPSLFLQRYAPPVLIDEIQYAPELLPHIKMMVDSTHVREGRFWLTGSQQFHLMKGVSETLAGRVAVINLLGLSRKEIMGEGIDSSAFMASPMQNAPRESKPVTPLGVMDLYREIWRGSFPAIRLDTAMDWELFYGSYVKTYLQRDVRELANIGDENTFLRFLRTCAARTGQLMNYADLARDADISPNTAKSWVSILKASGMIYLLQPFHSNMIKRMIKTPKLYFIDTGLCSYLTSWTSPETLEAGAMSGAIFETWVLGEILKSYWHNGREAPIYFYRDKDSKEIDVLIYTDARLSPVEIKKTCSPGKKDIRHFKAMDGLGIKTGPGSIICTCREPIPLNDSVTAVPAWCI